MNKWLETRRHHGRIQVRTREYDYHAYTRPRGRFQDLFRYDNCHGGTDSLHRVSIAALDVEEMPPLSVVIEEADFYASCLAGQADAGGNLGV